MRLIIDIDENLYTRLFDNGKCDAVDMLKACVSIRKGTPFSEGHWIEHEEWDGDMYYECSVCKEPYCLIDGTPTENLYNYCPNCGAHLPIIKSDRERNEDDADCD